MAAELPQRVTEYVEELESRDAGALVAVFDRNIDRAEHHAAWVLRTFAVLYSEPLPFSMQLVAKTGEPVPIAGSLRHMREPQVERFFVTSVDVVPQQ